MKSEDIIDAVSSALRSEEVLELFDAFRGSEAFFSAFAGLGSLIHL